MDTQIQTQTNNTTCGDILEACRRFPEHATDCSVGMPAQDAFALAHGYMEAMEKLADIKSFMSRTIASIEKRYAEIEKFEKSENTIPQPELPLI